MKFYKEIANFQHRNRDIWITVENGQPYLESESNGPDYLHNQQHRRRPISLDEIYRDYGFCYAKVKAEVYQQVQSMIVEY